MIYVSPPPLLAYLHAGELEVGADIVKAVLGGAIAGEFLVALEGGAVSLSVLKKVSLE